MQERYALVSLLMPWFAQSTGKFRLIIFFGALALMIVPSDLSKEPSI
jgi:hypothetical protein